MWITHYDILEFLHALQLRSVNLELHYMVLIITFCGLRIASGGFEITLYGFLIMLRDFGIMLLVL